MAEHDRKSEPGEEDDQRDRNDAPSQSSQSGESDRSARQGEDGDDSERIDLEPTESRPREAGATSRPVPLEEQFTCPNCNAVMPGDDAMVCLRCGFDIKTLNVQKTRIGKPVEADDDDEEEADEEEVGTETPICRPGRGDLWLPGVIGGLSAAVLVAGYLAGAPGLFPELRAAEPAALPAGFFHRMMGLLRFIILIALMGGCGFSGLWMLSKALSRPMGDVNLAAARIGAIVLAIRLVTFINFGEHRQVEFIVESVLQAALFIALSIVAFTIKPRTAMMLGGFALMTLLVIIVAARLIDFATW